MPEIDPAGVEAPYLQLASILRTRISDGDPPPGHRMPSQMELEIEFGLNAKTISKAIRVLREEGLVVSSPGRGFFVS